MQICPKCKVIIRHGEWVRATVLAQFLRDGLDNHILAIEDEECVEHMDCEPEPWEARVIRWARRKLRWRN